MNTQSSMRYTRATGGGDEPARCDPSADALGSVMCLSVASVLAAEILYEAKFRTGAAGTPPQQAPAAPVDPRAASAASAGTTAAAGSGSGSPVAAAAQPTRPAAMAPAHRPPASPLPGPPPSRPMAPSPRAAG